MIWHEWLCHTNFSFLTGTSHPGDLTQKAVDHGYASMAITDFDGVYGIARAYRYRHGLKLHYGAEIHLKQDHDLPLYFQDTLVLIAQTHRGYFNLCKILSYAHRNGKKDAYVPLEELSSLEDIIAIQPMRGLIRYDHNAAAKKYAVLKDTLYLAVSRHLSPAEDVWIEPTIALGKALNIPILLSQDIFFHDAQQKRMSDLVTAIRLNKPISEVSDHVFANDMRRPLSLPELQRIYGDLPIYKEALENSQKLADSIHFDLSELKYRYPREMIPDELTPQQYLEQLAHRHAAGRYTDAITHELNLVNQLGFADYFLTVYDIVNWARSQGILCQGRGSAANSAICFVLGITALDPSQFELLFERFISVERGDPPDIDVDFEHERREEVIQYIYRRFGRDKAAMVANVICFKTKGATRAVLKAEADPDLIPHLKGFPRHLGIHSGGFMVSDKPIDWLCPQEPATMPGRTVIEWCKDDIEALGFFKIDVLALGGLTLIKKCLELIKIHHGQTLQLDHLPLDDPDTYQMIQNADTIGTFQIESRAQMSFLPRHKPKTFYDLVVQVAIIRPGPIQGGMIHPYLRRRNGLEPVTFPDPRLEPILKRTFGVPIFQEQVMRVAMAVGGFSAGEADELRKNIGAFTLKKDQFWVGKLADGMRQNGVNDAFIESILGHIKGFASYGFPESHAASFALLAYITAYLKCHYPAAFFVAILNAQPMGFYEPDTLLKTAQRCGVEILPICIAHSTWDHQLENGKIRLGFRLVRGLSESGLARMNRTDLTAIAAANALQIFGLTRKNALWLAEAAPYAPLLNEPDDPVIFEPETELEATQLDYHATGTSVGKHPTQLMRTHAWVYDIPKHRLVSAEGIALKSNHSLVTVFGMVTCRQKPPTAKGVVFLTLWDETGAFNIVIKPELYLNYRSVIDGQSFLCIQGICQASDGARSILLTRVFEPKIEPTRPLLAVRNYM